MIGPANANGADMVYIMPVHWPKLLMPAPGAGVVVDVVVSVGAVLRSSVELSAETAVDGEGVGVPRTCATEAGGRPMTAPEIAP